VTRQPRRRSSGARRPPEEEVLRSIAELESAEAALRLAAARRFFEQPDDRAVPGLIRCLDTEDRVLLETAVEALGRCGDRRATGPLSELVRVLSDDSIGCVAAAALGELGDPEAIPALIHVHEHGDEANQAEARLALDRVPGGREALRAGLRDASSDRRQTALDALGSLGETDDVASVAAALEDPDQDVRARAARALGDIGDASAGDSLARALADPASDVRIAAAAAAGQLPDQVALDLLARAIEDPMLYVRRSAALGAAAALSPGRFALLARAASDPEASVRAAAVRALGGYAFPREANERPEEGALTALRSAIQDPDPQVRAQATAGLRGTLGSADAKKLLLELLDDLSAQVRREAISCIWAGRERGFEDVLVAALCDPEPSVRADTIRVLRELGVTTADDLIAALLKDEAAMVRSAAAQALRWSRSLSPAAVAALQGALTDEDSEVRHHATETWRSVVR